MRGGARTPLLASTADDYETTTFVRVLEAADPLAPAFDESTLRAESLDYEPVHSAVAAALKRRAGGQKRHVYGYTGETLAKWVATVVSGIVVGVLAWSIEAASTRVTLAKASLLTSMYHREGGSLAAAFGAYAGVSIAGILAAALMVLLWAPAASGGGVTHVIAFLNGSHVPDLLRMRTLITKVVGTVAAITSGLAVGPEAPLVHIGAAVAHQFTTCGGAAARKAEGAAARRSGGGLMEVGGIGGLKGDGGPLGRALRRIKSAIPFDLSSDTDAREFVSAGAAAGLAAAFGAPVGGVLFALEEAASFWSRKVTWRCLICAAFSTFTLAVLHANISELSTPGLLSFRGLRHEYQIYEMPIFAVVAGITGLLGALFNKSQHALRVVRAPAGSTRLRLLEALILTLLSVALMFALPQFFGTCLEQSTAWKHDNYGYAYTCAQRDGPDAPLVYNDLATMFFSPHDATIQHVLAMSADTSHASGGSATTNFTLVSLGIFAAAYVTLMALAFGVAVPGGLFMPSIIAGAAAGAFFGVIARHVFPALNLQPGLYALVGSAAMLGGVFRSCISLIVIMAEGTGAIDFLFAIIIGIVVGNWCASLVHVDGRYEADLEQDRSVVFLPTEPPKEFNSLTASNLMASPVVGFCEMERASRILHVLRETRHNGFPVFGADGNSRQVVGVILRKQLMVLLQQRAFRGGTRGTEEALPAAPALLYARGDRGGASYGDLMAAHSRRYEPDDAAVALEYSMRAFHHRWYTHRRHMVSAPEAVDQLELGWVHGAGGHDRGGARPDGRELLLDLTPYMNRAPLTIRADMSAARAHIIFRTLGLRHLVVVDANNRAVGMITRKDIVTAMAIRGQSRGPAPPSADSVADVSFTVEEGGRGGDGGGGGGGVDPRGGGRANGGRGRRERVHWSPDVQPARRLDEDVPPAAAGAAGAAGAGPPATGGVTFPGVSVVP